MEDTDKNFKQPENPFICSIFVEKAIAPLRIFCQMNVFRTVLKYVRPVLNSILEL